MLRKNRRKLLPALEPMERRAVPAGAVTASLSHGALLVEGTDGADQLRVQVIARPRGRGGVVRVDGMKRAIPLQRVRSITLIGGDGDDRLSVDVSGGRLIPVRLDGGAGNDVLLGTPGDDVLLGGQGADNLFGRGGADRLDGGVDLDIIDGVAETPPTPPQVESGPPPVDPMPMPEPAPAPPTPEPAPAPPVAPTPQPTPAPSAPVPGLDALERRIIELTNQERARAGLEELTVNAKLSQAAEIHGSNMARLGVFAHVLPDTDTPSLADRARRVDYSGTFVGENLAFNYVSAEAAMRAWMESPGHRANILRANFCEIGVAVVFDGDGQPYFVQVFGCPIA